MPKLGHEHEDGQAQQELSGFDQYDHGVKLREKAQR
jgi:hypothetical protein